MSGMDVEEPEEVDALQLEFDAIDEENEKNVDVYEKLMKNDRTDDLAVKVKESVLYRIARLQTQCKNMEGISSLMKKNANFFGQIPKAKTAKIVRTILTIAGKIPDSVDIQVKLCEDLIKWCNEEKRTFLRQRIEARYACLLLLQKKPSEALTIVNALLSELKKLDDKQMLTEVHLTESRIYHVLENIPKSKASLTASRSSATSIYVVPLLQAELDEMSGILCCEEGDCNTAYSYFQEAFDAYDSASDKNAIKILKYMILAKVLEDKPQDVPSLLASKAGLKYASPDIEAMAAITKAVKARSLENFEAAVAAHSTYLRSDDLINHNLDHLYDRMFEGNLEKIIMPFGSVEIAHVAKLISLPVDKVERKLGQMILDHKVSGILDQGRGILEIFDPRTEDKAYSRGMEIIDNMTVVVDTLMARALRFNRGEPLGGDKDDKDKNKKKGDDKGKDKGKSPGKPSPSKDRGKK